MLTKQLTNSIVCLGIGASVLLAQAAMGQDAKSVIAAAEKAMGSTNTIQYTGTGFSANVGQSVNPTSPWPKFDITAYTRAIDYISRSGREELTRVQGNNPPRGGGAPIVGEQKQNQRVSGNYAWNVNGNANVAQFGLTYDERLLQLYMTPHGFVRAAKLGNGCAVRWDCEAKLVSKTEGGKKVNVIVAGVGKYSLEGTLDENNMLTKIETKFPNPVLGDMPIVTTFSDYKDYNGVKFPSKITQQQGPYPSFELNVTDVKTGVDAALAVPENVRNAEVPTPRVDVQLLAEGVWYLTGGSHHSLVIEFNNYMAIIEGPLNEDRSNAVLAEAKRLVINKPVRYLINTHHHFDHSGGLRTYVAEGSTIITHAMNKPFYEQTFKAKWTIAPDKLSQMKMPKVPVFLPITDKYILTDGMQKVEIYATQGQNHNEGMLIAYIPSGKVLVEVDDWTPPPPDAKPPDMPPAAALNLYANVQRLKLDVARIAPLHGRLVSNADFLKFLGKAPAK